VIPTSLREVAAAVGGTLVDVVDPDQVVVTSCVSDSRHAVPGALFVALSGARVDGHEYAVAALEAGAVAVLSSRPVGVASVVVDDVLLALGRLARAQLARLPHVTVVGITGSAGKTTTKDLLAELLATQGPTIAPPGSFNNELGLPLTVLRADADTRFLVLEMGARGVHHIAYLCDVAPPRIGVELMVGSAHVGEFGDRESIARAKAELVQALPADGTAVLNADDPAVAAMADQATGRILRFGQSPAADVRAEELALGTDACATFRLVTPDGDALVRLGLVGAHHVTNALAAAATAWVSGVTTDTIAELLTSARPLSRWRMEVTTRADGAVVINDAYNASPESMRAALQTLKVVGAGRRTWAVLGEMLELGDAAVAEHDAIGRLVVRLDVDRLLVVGEGAKPMHLAAQMEGSWGRESEFVPDVAAAIDLLAREVRAGDVVLVKASRAASLERVAAALLDEVAA
jgi:UDP-N-acetylmuramoyl-tripeptide--D-alanyl-D-alanine ligase